MSDKRESSSFWGWAFILFIATSMYGARAGWFNTDIHGNETSFGKAYRKSNIETAGRLLNLKLSLPMSFSKDIYLTSITCSDRHLVMSYVVGGIVPDEARVELKKNLSEAILRLHCSAHKDYKFLRISGVPTLHRFTQADGNSLFDITFEKYDCP